MRIYWRNHTSSGDWVRVWRSTWTGDTFEVVNRESFDIMQRLFVGVAEFVEAEDEA